MKTRSCHLARRFFRSLRRGDISPQEVEWVYLYLSEEEIDLWERMSPADRRHGVGVAREVEESLGSSEPPIIVAALLHDVGKVTSGFGTLARVLVTLVGAVTAPSRHQHWEVRSGLFGRLGRYLRHSEQGAALLHAAKSDPVVVTWAAEHHLPRSRWTLAVSIAGPLKEADNE